MDTPATSRVLVLFAHPALHKSRVNKVLVRTARETEGVRVHDLYECYPDLDIDIATEQQALLDHDVIVMQHPFLWYSVPAILKEWMDLVLEHGWAYGSRGTRLRGKWMMSAISSGGGESAYGPDGINRYTMREFLLPLEQTARLCGMRYVPPFLVQGTHSMKAESIDECARDYRRVLEALRDGRIETDGLDALPRINDALDALVGGSDA